MSLTFYTKTPANASAGECKFASSGCWHFFVFRNSGEKLCVSWALPFVECVAVWALKLPVPHTDALKTHSSQTFSTNLPEPKRVKTNTCHKLLAKNTVFLSCIVTKMKLQFPIWRCCENNLKRIVKGGGWCKRWMLFLVFKSLC